MQPSRVAMLSSKPMSQLDYSEQIWMKLYLGYNVFFCENAIEKSCLVMLIQGLEYETVQVHVR